MAPDIMTREIRMYLLGQLDEDAAAALEARYFADPVLADDIREAETELVDAYVAGALDAGTHTAFEAHYLASPVHRDRVATARALESRLAAAAAASAAAVVNLDMARRRRPAPPAFYGWLALAAALLIVSLWALARPVQGPSQAQRQSAPTSAPSPSPAHAPAPSVPAPAPSPAPPTARSVLAFALSPIVTRGESPEPQRLPAGPADLLIRLEGSPVASDRGYAVEIQTVDGRSRWQGRATAGAANSGILATVRVPAERLAADDYVVVLRATTASGREERGRYVLRLRAR